MIRIAAMMLFCLLIATGQATGNKDKTYLQTVLKNLQQIQSAEYEETTERWQTGNDKQPLDVSNRYYKECDYPQDTLWAAYL